MCMRVKSLVARQLGCKGSHVRDVLVKPLVARQLCCKGSHVRDVRVKPLVVRQLCCVGSHVHACEVICCAPARWVAGGRSRDHLLHANYSRM